MAVPARATERLGITIGESPRGAPVLIARRTHLNAVMVSVHFTPSHNLAIPPVYLGALLQIIALCALRGGHQEHVDIAKLLVAGACLRLQPKSRRVLQRLQRCHSAAARAQSLSSQLQSPSTAVSKALDGRYKEDHGAAR